MDLQKIGKFLAELRKERGLTQEQLGEQLGVTNKTVSRWENGNYLPPVEILQLLSEIYGLTINEIISAQRLNTEEYREKAEENIKTALLLRDENRFTSHERHDYFHKKWYKEHMGMILLEVAVFLTFIVACALFHENVGFMLLCALGMYRTGVHNRQYNEYMADKKAVFIHEDEIPSEGKRQFYRRHWLKEHLLVHLLCMLPAFAFMFTGAIRSDLEFVILGSVLGFLTIIVRGNELRNFLEQMMIND